MKFMKAYEIYDIFNKSVKCPSEMGFMKSVQLSNSAFLLSSVSILAALLM